MTTRELRIVNPNTDTNVTRWLREEASRVAGDAFEVVAVNADFRSCRRSRRRPKSNSPRWPCSPRSRRRPTRGAVVAAFGDPGLSEARALGSTAVVGLGECGLLAAGLGGRRFSVVTLGAAIRETILRQGRVTRSERPAGRRALSSVLDRGADRGSPSQARRDRGGGSRLR